MGDKGGIGPTQKVQQDERLNKKHIQTLGYVQELMNENKRLRHLIEEYEQQKLHCDDLHSQNEAAQEKIKKIQEQCLAKADEISAGMARKHEVEQNRLKAEKLDAERRLEMQTREMALEIERLQKLNTSLEEALRAKATLASNQSELREQNEFYKQQIVSFQSQIRSLLESNANQLKEMKLLEQSVSQQKLLKEQLSSSNQTIKELQSRVKQLESELLESNKALAELQESEVKSYKNKLVKALNEVSHLQHQVYIKDSDMEKVKQKLAALMDELEDVQTQRFSLEREIERLKNEITELKRQVALLKGKSDEGGTFKEFVAIKRELATLQEEHNKLINQTSQPNSAYPKASSANKSKRKINLTLR